MLAELALMAETSSTEQGNNLLDMVDDARLQLQRMPQFAEGTALSKKWSQTFLDARIAVASVRGMIKPGMDMNAFTTAAQRVYDQFFSKLQQAYTEATGVVPQIAQQPSSVSVTTGGGTITPIAPVSGGIHETEYWFDMGDQAASPVTAISQATKDLFSKITGSFVGPPVPEGFQYETPSAPPSSPDRQLLPEERPEYAAAIAAGLDPEIALGMVKTDTFAKNAAASGNAAGALTTPGPGKTSMPWLTPQNIMGVVGTMFSGWSQYEQAKLAAQLTAAQQQGRQIQLPPTVNNYVQKKAFPWVPVGIGVAGLLAFGLIAYFMMKD